MKKKYQKAGLFLIRFSLLAVLGYGGILSAPFMATAQEAQIDRARQWVARTTICLTEI